MKLFTTPTQLTVAQRILCLCGVDLVRLAAGGYSRKNRSHTKKGPGRRHWQGGRHE